MNFHELKDIVSIYSTHEGKYDNTWNNAQIKVWNPVEQREMDLVFTGSSRGETPEQFQINFNISYKDQAPRDVFEAVKNTLKALFPKANEEELKEYNGLFMKELYQVRNPEN